MGEKAKMQAVFMLKVKPDLAKAAKALLDGDLTDADPAQAIEWLDIDTQGVKVPSDLEKMLKSTEVSPGTLGLDRLWPHGSLEQPSMSDPLVQETLQNPQVIVAMSIRIVRKRVKGIARLYHKEWGQPTEKVEIRPESGDPADVATIQAVHGLLRKHGVIPDQRLDIEGYLKGQLKLAEAEAQRHLQEHQKHMDTAHDILGELGKIGSKVARPRSKDETNRQGRHIPGKSRNCATETSKRSWRQRMKREGTRKDRIGRPDPTPRTREAAKSP